MAKSRYVLPSQFVFLAANALGLVLGTVYNAQTPDLYPNNAHHRIGWIITWVISAQVVVSLLRHVGGAFKGSDSQLAEERRSFIPLPTDAPEARSTNYYSSGYRLSNDSGQGSEPTTESLRSNSISTLGDHDRHYDKELEDDDEELDGPTMPMPMPKQVPQSKTTLMAIRVISSKLWKYLDFGYKTVDRIILPFGFIAYVTGIATYGRLFVRFSLRLTTTTTTTTKNCALTRLLLSRRVPRFSADWRTGSRAASSSGWGSSRWAAGRGASTNRAGLGICVPARLAGDGRRRQSGWRASSSSSTARPTSFWSTWAARMASGRRAIWSTFPLPSSSWAVVR